MARQPGGRLGDLPLRASGQLPLGESPRLPSRSIYRALYTELPLAYDAAARQVRQRDTQARLAELQVDHRFEPNSRFPTLPTDYAIARFIFYSPLDDVLIEYDQSFSTNGPLDTMTLQPRVGLASDWHSPPPDFKDSPGLREPWERGWVLDSLYKTWDLAGQPPAYHVSLTFSARVPYDVFVFLDNGKFGPEGKLLGVLVSLNGSYHFSPTLYR